MVRRPVPNPRAVVTGLVYVTIGLALFLVGLEKALFPLGRSMARQLADPTFVGASEGLAAGWEHYVWVYLFAAAIGFSTTIAEPALLAVSLKASEVSGGTVRATGLRVAVAIGVGVGVTLGVFRIVTGTPLHYYIIAGYALVLVQTAMAPPGDRRARLRFGRRHHLHGDRAHRHRPGAGARRFGARAERGPRRFRTHRVRDPVLHHGGARVRADFPLAGLPAWLNLLPMPGFGQAERGAADAVFDGNRPWVENLGG